MMMKLFEILVMDSRVICARMSSLWLISARFGVLTTMQGTYYVSSLFFCMRETAQEPLDRFA